MVGRQSRFVVGHDKGRKEDISDRLPCSMFTCSHYVSSLDALLAFLRSCNPAIPGHRPCHSLSANASPTHTHTHTRTRNAQPALPILRRTGARRRGSRRGERPRQPRGTRAAGRRRQRRGASLTLSSTQEDHDRRRRRRRQQIHRYHPHKEVTGTGHRALTLTRRYRRRRHPHAGSLVPRRLPLAHVHSTRSHIT